jgi:hypothetical protein
VCTRGFPGRPSPRVGSKAFTFVLPRRDVVIAYIEAFADELDECGRRLVVRNGYHAERDVVGGGQVALTERGRLALIVIYQCVVARRVVAP